MSEKNSCINCMELKRGDCVGGKDKCEFFRFSPFVSGEEKKNWPKSGEDLIAQSYERLSEWYI